MVEIKLRIFPFLSLRLRINCHDENIVFGVIVVIGQFKNLEKNHSNAHVCSRKVVACRTLEIWFFQLILAGKWFWFFYLQLGIIKLITALVTLCRDLSVLFMYQLIKKKEKSSFQRQLGHV